MALSAGDRLGPYEILAPLGAGGMGEVYRASDTRLDRIIAVKVLPSEYSTSPTRRERLEREAKAVSQLSHPHICTLYDIGREGETDFLVMEYLEGESLADRLGRGRLPVEQALRYASEIADALHDAHRHGVVHRDLKPGNVMLTRSGAKLLDFGLAKLRETASVDDAELASSSPTMGAPLTEEGMIVGTYPYMAPEQLEGKPVDARTDLFAFGAILYEMVTGQRPFLGESRASLVAAIMSSQPRPMRELVPLTPPSLDRVVRRCLEKDPDERWESAGDLAAELRWIHSLDAESEEAPRTTGGAATRRMAASAATSLALVVAAGLLGWELGPGASAPDGVFRTARQVTFQKGTERKPALSPDGRYVVYVSDANGNDDIYLQRVDGSNALNLTADSLGGDGEPAFSPDGNQIAFRSERGDGGVFVMGATGESVRRLSGVGHNPSWSPDGSRLAVSTEGITDPLRRQATGELWIIDLATGEARRRFDGDAVQPAWSPDGRLIAFWHVDNNSGQRDLATITADGEGDPTAVTNDVPVDCFPVWSADGSSLFFVSDRGGTMDLWRIAVDPETGGAGGEPRLVGAPAEEVAWLSASAEGSLAYESRSAIHLVHSLPLDPEKLVPVGELHAVHASALPISYINPSPDGTLIALTTRGTREDLYVLDDDGGRLRQLTYDRFRDRGPQWSPDGAEIAFYSNRSGTYQIWSIRADGSGLRQLTDVTEGAWFPFWSTDGTRIAFPTGYDTCVISVADAPASTADCLPDLSDEHWFQVLDWSADGRWLVGSRSLRAGRILPDLLIWSFEANAYQPLEQRGLVARWLPDSRHIVLLEDGGRLALLDRVTGHVRDLGSHEIEGAVGPEGLGVSRDGRTLLFRSDMVESNVWILSASDAKGDE